MPFGGVATGNINAQLAAKVAGSAKIKGSTLMPIARAATTGRKVPVVAVLLVSSVRKAMRVVITITSTIVPAPPKPRGFHQSSLQDQFELQKKQGLVHRQIV